MVLAAKPRLRLLAERLSPERRMRIADVGANPIGAPLYRRLVQLDLAEVWGFEPHQDAYERLLSQTGDTRIHYAQTALGAPGPGVLNAYPASEMSSLYKLCPKATGYLGHFKRHLGRETEVPVTLSALDDLAEVPPLDLLKIDAQGAELDVISGARAKLSDAVAVVAEMRFYRLYAGEPTLGELDAALRAQGFVLHRFLHQKSRMLGHSQRARVSPQSMQSQLIDGDAVYIRNLEEPGALSALQLKHLALLAEGVFGSPDLALFCLDRLSERGAVGRVAARRYVNTLPSQMLAEA